MTNSKFSKAFTLIELLVVVVIVAILASILLPVMNAVIEDGRTTKCASNLRQIGAAMFLYAGEHNGYFPQSGATIPWGQTDAPPPNGSGQNSWMEQLSVYMNLSSNVSSAASAAGDPQYASGKSVFTCPSSSIALPADQYYSYFNGAHAAYAANGSVFSAVKQQSIAFPTKTILSGDISHVSWPNGTLDADKDDFTQNPFDTLSTFHRGRVNILFADGHVSLLSWNKNLSTPGYFDVTTMATHYSGSSLDDPTITSYLNP